MMYFMWYAHLQVHVLFQLLVSVVFSFFICARKRESVFHSLQAGLTPAVLRSERIGNSAHKTLILSMSLCCCVYFIHVDSVCSCVCVRVPN